MKPDLRMEAIGGTECCGFKELLNLPQHMEDWDAGIEPEWEEYGKPDKWGNRKEKEVWPTLKEIKAAVEDDVSANVKSAGNYSHMFCALLPWQNQHFGSILKKHGFKYVSNTVNSNSGNRLFLYVYTRPENKLTRKPKLSF